MSRKLLFLNGVLVLVVAYAGVLLRNEFKAGKAREAAMYRARVNATPPQPLVPLAEQPPVRASAFPEIATKTLFHPSRDSSLPPEVPPPPPPKPPMPALPKYHGTMNIGDGPVALLAMGSGPGQEVRAGETIGPFKLVDFNTVDMTFEWQDETVRRTLDQLTDRTIMAASSGDSGSRSVASVPASVAAPVVSRPMGPGDATNFGFKTCQPNDSTPVGTVQDGFRKVETLTPFGKSCRWDPVGR